MSALSPFSRIPLPGGLTGLILCLCLWQGLPVIAQQADQPPNIVLIVIDDIGYHDLGIYGNALHATPNIDRLGREGMLFTDFHTNGAVCSPTRAALLTGQYQQRTGIEYALGFDKDIGMPLKKLTLAEMLETKGYSSGVFGKWHLGFVKKFGPNDQGFDESYVSNNTPDYHSHISRTGEPDWYHDQKPQEESGYLTDLVTRHSLDFITNNSDHPFFLFISHIAAHFPFQGPDDPAHRTAGQLWHATKYGPLPESQYRRAYRDMIEAVDRSVGEVTAKLDELHLRDNTLIIITSDNGAYSWVGSNYPFRGEKGSLYEGGHRVPALANWPGHIPPHSVSDATVMTMDLAPTFLGLARIAPPADPADRTDGMDLSQVLLKNAELPERKLFWHFKNPYTHTYSYAERHGDWKYLVEEGNAFLFNLGMDPTESNNLLSNYPGIAKQMEKDYQQWLTELDELKN